MSRTHRPTTSTLGNFKHRLAALSLSAVTLCVGLLYAVLAGPSDGKGGVVAGNGDLVLSAQELAELPSKARAGDATAAVRLAQYYDFIALESATARQWWTVAAEAGNAVAQYNLAAQLLESDDPASIANGRAWLQRAAQAGDRAAIQRLENESQNPTPKR